MKGILLKPIEDKRLKCKHIDKDSIETITDIQMLEVLGWSVCDIGYCTKCKRRVMQIGDYKPWKVFEVKIININ